MMEQTQPKQNPKQLQKEDEIKRAYARGYMTGWKKADRLQKRLFQIKMYIREVWRILSKVKDEEK